LSVAVRQSWFSGLAHWLFYVPIAFLGFPLWSFVLMHGLNLIYQFWIHTKLVKNLGFLEHFLNTPSHHRVHHGVNDAYLDKNYGGIFIFWDRLFGSFVREDETPRYGIIKPIDSYNWLWINTHGWLEMLAAMKKQKTFSGKIRCVFGSPNMDFRDYEN
ncbi:MAG TPA: sterol desaturase family protein, partial [Pyrinomonadaceae bacterium]